MKTVVSALILVLFTTFLSPVQAQKKTLKLNNLQVIGSHNSYKKAIEPALYKFIKAKDSTHQLSNLEYEHVSMTDQLNLGLRNLEIDVLADSEGGKYAKPKGLELVKPEHPYDTAGVMNKPGFKILHMPDFDFRTSNLTLEGCLQELRTWSDANPDHIPVFITLEPKDGEKNWFGTTPEPFTTALFDKLDACIRENLGEDKLITPDLVRGNYETLEAAVLQQNWPELTVAKGKFFFLLDDNGKKKNFIW